MNDISVLIINYQTPDLLDKAVNSFLKFYPDIRIIVFDNGSKDNSSEIIKGFVEKHSNIQAHFSKKNIFHGPAMDFALRNLVKTKYCFILDSDTETLKGGFLEEMKNILEKSENNYAIGSEENVNKRGFLDADGKIRIIISPFMLLKKSIYLKFSPFIHHGQPVMFNFNEAAKNGYAIFNYPIEEYINHLWQGTASRFGYKLGVKSKIDFVVEKLLNLVKKR